MSVGDVDGDGRAEIMMKTAPGTNVGGRYITMPREDVRAGYRTPTTTGSAPPATAST